MGHYYTDFMCDDCGKLYGCDCYKKKQQKYSEEESDKLLKILEKSEVEFINAISKLIEDE